MGLRVLRDRHRAPHPHGARQCTLDQGFNRVAEHIDDRHFAAGGEHLLHLRIRGLEAAHVGVVDDFRRAGLFTEQLQSRALASASSPGGEQHRGALSCRRRLRQLVRKKFLDERTGLLVHVGRTGAVSPVLGAQFARVVDVENLPTTCGRQRVVLGAIRAEGYRGGASGKLEEGAGGVDGCVSLGSRPASRSSSSC